MEHGEHMRIKKVAKKKVSRVAEKFAGKKRAGSERFARLHGKK